MFPKGLRKYVVAAAILLAFAIWAVINGHYLLAFFEAWLAVGMFGKYVAYYDEYGAMARRSLRLLIIAAILIAVLLFGVVVTDRTVGLEQIIIDYM